MGRFSMHSKLTYCYGFAKKQYRIELPQFLLKNY